jgi:hypothetical protein
MPMMDEKPGASLVLERMQAQIACWDACADRRCIFLKCYHLMTSNMVSGLRAGRFEDAAWVSSLLEHFAAYYFDALAAWEREPVSAPRVWQLAHQACRQPDVLVLQSLLLGVNAHINYDLVLVLVELLEGEWARLGTPSRRVRYADYCRVNTIIAETIDEVQDTVLEPAAPLMDLVDKGLGRLDELVISRLITGWRRSVWGFSVRMMEASSLQERAAAREAMEGAALRRAEALLGRQGLAGLRALL